MAIHADIAQLDDEIEQRFEQHTDAPILLSMPGFGVVLAATFLANTRGDLSAFENVDRLASVAGSPPRHETRAGSVATTTGRGASTGA
jgi:transposase